MNAQYIKQMKIESGLVRAIEQNEFEILPTDNQYATGDDF